MATRELTVGPRAPNGSIGGGCKPWHEIIAGIVEGSIAINGGWSRGGARKFANRVIVKGDTRALDIVAWSARTRNDLGRDPRLSQRDACESLNLDPAQIRPPVEAGVLRFSREGKRLAISAEDVVAYAAIMIPPAELAHRLGTRADAVHAVVDRWKGV